jgi:hypothetical protein
MCPGAIDGARDQRFFLQVRAGPIVIFHVTEQQVTEVALAEYNNVGSDRTDQPFSISILPRGARRRGSIAAAHRSESADKDLTIGGHE